MNIDDLFERNRAWAAKECASDSEFFSRLAHQQSPEYLWIGCSDSRVPANEIIGLRPGDVFVHRNVANLVVHSDLNCLSVIQYAVEVLQVKSIIVCGHYGCGGVKTAMSGQQHGLIDNWLRHIKDLHLRYHAALGQAGTDQDTVDKMCELNVVTQAVNVGSTTIVQDAWQRDQALSIHALVYSINDGLLKNLNTTMSSVQEHQHYTDALNDEARILDII